ncbi:MAG: 50S ribosomal protein L11 methyltransferase [Anaerolineaceae bacterium]
MADGEARWLEVSVTGDGEIAEAVAEVLGRFAAGGVVVETGVTYNDAEDEGTPFGPVRVYGYLEVNDQLEDARQRLSESLWHLGQIKPIPEPVFKEIEDEDWMAAWKKNYRPIPIGKRLLILPAWLEQTDKDRLAVKIDPSMAFGTGTHPTTQLCLEMVETYTQPGQVVMDVGCGSGILSIGAIKMGAIKAIAVDIDMASVKSTRENAAANDVLDAIETGLGSVAEILQGNFSQKQAPLVLANILAPVIIRLFDAGLADLLIPDGRLILSGILFEQFTGVVKAAEAKGLHLIERRQIGDWVALALKN